MIAAKPLARYQSLLLSRQSASPNAEIKLRAVRRIGELSKALETHERVRTDLHPATGRQTKAAALKDAGLSTSVAHRCEPVGRADVDRSRD
jgi:CelD/BcsL family acetyltransferase involved in cellulose biosynthesis